jgi:DNA transformation protein
MDQAELDEIFAGLGPVSTKRLFGGRGVYFRRLIIAIHWRDALLLKADAVSAPQFIAAGARQWLYSGKTGRQVKMPYWTIPEAALDDPDLMAGWLRLAYDAALRSTGG